MVPLRIGVPPGPAAQTGNRYAFATGNPLLAADPSGHFNNHLIMPVRLFGSLTLQFVPLVGDGYALFAGVTGYDPIAGISLSPEERALIVGGMIGVGAIAVIAARLRGLAPRVAQAEELSGLARLGRADDVADVRATRHLDQAGDAGGARRSTKAEDAVTAPTQGQTVYRVYGGDSAPGGASWSPINPASVANYRDVGGLPSGGASGVNNSGRFVIEGVLEDPRKVVLTRKALPLDGMSGGLPEYIVPGWTDNGAITITRVSGVTPEF